MTAPHKQEFAEIEVGWLSQDDGGRSLPLRMTGRPAYSPHLRVGPTGESLGVAFVDGNPEVVSPGERGIATVLLMYERVNYAALAPGAEFEVLEGPNVVGRGRVLRRFTK